MATSREYIEEFLERMGVYGVRVRPMFGDYVVYCEEKPVGCICDDKLYVRITNASRRLWPSAPEASPYAGAKPRFLIENTDAEFLTGLLHAIAAGSYKPKKRK